MAHRTASKPTLSLSSLSEVPGKDLFNSGNASTQWPVSASFAPRSATAEGSEVVGVFLATWAAAAIATDAKKKLTRIALMSSCIIKKKASTPRACLQVYTPVKVRRRASGQIECFARPATHQFGQDRRQQILLARLVSWYSLG